MAGVLAREGTGPKRAQRADGRSRSGRAEVWCMGENETTGSTGTARKVVIHRPGAYDRLTFADVPLPVLGPHEVSIDVRAIGVNYADVIVRMGLYASAKELVGWPITPGFEVAGVVRAVGAEVKDLAPGARVLAC